MVLSNQRMLEKATLTLSDFGGTTTAPLTIEQVQTFLRLAITNQAILPDVRTVMANANKWQESKINFDERIMRPGTELTRLVEADRISPGTGLIEISTVLIRGEVPISDEVMEDQVERAGFGNTVMSMVAEGAGRDIEELLVNGDTSYSSANASDQAWFQQLDGWLKQAQGAGGNVVDATNIGQDYQTVFNRLLTALPDRYKRDKANMRFYVPTQLEEKYRDQLAQRGTVGGDAWLEGARQLKYQEIPIHPVPLLGITSGSPDTTFVMLSHRLNLYAGYRRQIRMETWRDPREGGTSFIVTARVDAKLAHVPATAIATGVNVEP